MANSLPAISLWAVLTPAAQRQADIAWEKAVAAKASAYYTEDSATKRSGRG